MFLSGVIPSLKDKKEKEKLIPWPQFKHTIFDIIDNRIEFAPEINGAVNNSYLGMDEHLVAF